MQTVQALRLDRLFLWVEIPIAQILLRFALSSVSRVKGDTVCGGMYFPKKASKS